MRLTYLLDTTLVGRYYGTDIRYYYRYSYYYKYYTTPWACSIRDLNKFIITSGSVFCGSLSKAGKFAITGGEEDKAYVWDTTSGEIILNCTGHKDSVIFAEFNFDETYLATGDMSGVIQVWKLNDKSSVWNYNMGDATVNILLC